MFVLQTDEESFPLRPSYGVFVEEDLTRTPPTIPVQAFDEPVENLFWRGVSSYLFQPIDEQYVGTPLGSNILLVLDWEGDDGRGLRAYNAINFWDVEDFWDAAPAAIPINFFDEFEDQYSSLPLGGLRAYSLFSFEDEQSIKLPVIVANFLTAGFDETDWWQRFDTRYAPITTEEDFGAVPIFVPTPVWEEYDQSKICLVAYAPQTLEEDTTFWARLAPPPIPPQDWSDSHLWQMLFDYRIAQATIEEDMPVQRFIPTMAWDEVDWNKLFVVDYAGLQPEPDEIQTYGWFLNPPPIPPPPFCPLPPAGADKDINMSIFGGAANPLKVLFCRICKSKNPLIVRADYAIWCQDCCAFVSKQDTYMGTLQAPGQLKNVF